MTLKEKINQLNNEFTVLKNKIKTKLQTQQKSLTETTQKLNESNHKLELTLKESSENEKVLATLSKEFEELSKELDA